MVDPTRLSSLLSRLLEELNEIQALGALPDDQLDRRTMNAAKYGLVVACEISIDIAEHVISSEGFRPSTDFADTFVVLEERGLLDKDLSQRLQNMARFRNLLVHGYAQVDDARVRAIMRSDIDDLRTFREAIARAFL